MRFEAQCIALLIVLSQAIWSAEIKIGEGKQPQAAVDPAGNIYIVYGQKNEIFCSTSSDAGKSYSTPVLIAKPSGMPLGMRRGPRVAATANSVVVTAVTGEVGGGKDGDVASWRSTDKGKTWVPAAKTINTAAGAAREGLHSHAAGPNDQFYCAWLDLRNNKTEIWGAYSSDGGLSWVNEKLIYKSPDGGVCPCCHPSVAIDPKGSINILFRNDLKGDKDMYFCRSTDGGKTFTAGTKVGAGAWKLNACPMDGGAITAGPDAMPVTVWRRQNTVFVAAPGQAERELGAGLQPAIASGPGGFYTTWINKRPGAVMILVPGGAPTKISDNGSDPSIAGSLDGKGPVVLTWESQNNVMTSILKTRN